MATAFRGFLEAHRTGNATNRTAICFNMDMQCGLSVRLNIIFIGWVEHGLYSTLGGSIL